MELQSAKLHGIQCLFIFADMLAIVRKKTTTHGWTNRTWNFTLPLLRLRIKATEAKVILDLFNASRGKKTILCWMDCFAQSSGPGIICDSWAFYLRSYPIEWLKNIFSVKHLKIILGNKTSLPYLSHKHMQNINMSII